MIPQRSILLWFSCLSKTVHQLLRSSLLPMSPQPSSTPAESKLRISKGEVTLPDTRPDSIISDLLFCVNIQELETSGARYIQMSRVKVQSHNKIASILTDQDVAGDILSMTTKDARLMCTFVCVAWKTREWNSSSVFPGRKTSTSWTPCARAR